MWFTINEIESKYGISKFSIYSLITKDDRLRRFIKANEGSLEVSQEGLDIILEMFSGTSEDENSKVEQEDIMPIDDSTEENLFNKNKPLDLAGEIDSLEDLKDPSAAPEINQNSLFDTVSPGENDDFFNSMENKVSLDNNEIEPLENIDMNMPDDDEIDYPLYIKALKEKMIIQNQQIRVLDQYLDTCHKLLLQDEKIVGILEKLNTK